MKTFQQYEEHAKRLEVRREYDLAVVIRTQALNLENVSKQERAHLLLAIGGTYLYMNKQPEATKYFDAFLKRYKI